MIARANDPCRHQREPISSVRFYVASAGVYPRNDHSFLYHLFSLHGLGQAPSTTHQISGVKNIVPEPRKTLSVQPSIRQGTFTIRFEDEEVPTSEDLERMTKFSGEQLKDSFERTHGRRKGSEENRKISMFLQWEGIHACRFEMNIRGRI